MKRDRYKRFVGVGARWCAAGSGAQAGVIASVAAAAAHWTRVTATKLARRHGGGKVANRPKGTLASRNWFCGKRLTRPRSAILCAAMRLQIGGTQRCFNNILSQPPRLLTPEACCSTSAARKLPTPWGVCYCNWHAREAINNGANDNIKRKRLRMLLKTCVLGRCCPEAQGRRR